MNEVSKQTWDIFFEALDTIVYSDIDTNCFAETIKKEAEKRNMSGTLITFLIHAKE